MVIVRVKRFQDLDAQVNLSDITEDQLKQMVILRKGYQLDTPAFIPTNHPNLALCSWPTKLTVLFTGCIVAKDKAKLYTVFGEQQDIEDIDRKGRFLDYLSSEAIISTDWKIFKMDHHIKTNGIIHRQDKAVIRKLIHGKFLNLRRDCELDHTQPYEFQFSDYTPGMYLFDHTC